MYIPNEQNADTSVVLVAYETKIGFKVVKSSLCNRVSVEIVEKVHRPQSRHDAKIEFSDKSNLLGIGLADGTGVVKIFNKNTVLEHIDLLDVSWSNVFLVIRHGMRRMCWTGIE